MGKKLSLGKHILHKQKVNESFLFSWEQNPFEQLQQTDASGLELNYYSSTHLNLLDVYLPYSSPNNSLGGAI